MNKKIDAIVEDTKARLDKELNFLFESENDKLNVLVAVMQLSAEEQDELLRLIEQG